MLKISAKAEVYMNKMTQLTTMQASKRVMMAGVAVEKIAKDLTGKGGGGSGVASSPGQPPFTQSSDLKNGIKARRKGPLTVFVGPSVFYGKFLEFGTRLMAARPFMRPALHKAQKQFANLFRRLW